jgi:AcrR family transcriptional regulator
MGTTERRERERLETRGRILDAARELFVELGYDAVTMRKVAEKAEYSATAIYHHFDDKKDLLRELCDQDFRQLASRFTEFAGVADPIEKLRAVGRAYIDFGLAFPNHYRLMFMTAHEVMDSCESHLKKGVPEEDAYAFVRQAVEQCIAAKRFRPELSDVDLVTQAFWAAGHGVASLIIAKGKDPWCEWRAPEEIARVLVENVIRGMEA